MIRRTARALLLTLTLAAACVPPPTVVAPAAWTQQDAAPAPPPRATDKSTAVLRPRFMNRTLASEALTPAVPTARLNAGLYPPTPTAALRSAGLVQLSRQHGAQGRPDAALAAARGGHALALEAYGPNHAETLTALTALGDALGAAGHPTQAEAVLLIASSRARRAFGPQHPAAEAAAQRLTLRRALAPIAPLLRSFGRGRARLS